MSVLFFSGESARSVFVSRSRAALCVKTKWRLADNVFRECGVTKRAEMCLIADKTLYSRKGHVKPNVSLNSEYILWRYLSSFRLSCVMSN